MASTYGYITVAVLEAFAGLDYSQIDSTFTDSIIEAQITAAEEYVNALCYPDGSTYFTGTIPNGVQLATKFLARRFMRILMVDRGHQTSEEVNSLRAQDLIIDKALHAHKSSGGITIASGRSDTDWT